MLSNAIKTLLLILACFYMTYDSHALAPTVDDKVYQAGYFSFLAGDPNTKVDFTYGIALNRKYNFLFEYNQTMFWELQSDSKPFRDINFNPLLVQELSFGSFLVRLGLLEHHSNGKDSTISRSYNSSFIDLSGFSKTRSYKISYGAKIKTFYSLGEYNKDIVDYLGHIEFYVYTNFYRHQDSSINEIRFNVTSSPGGEYDRLFKYGFEKIDLILDMKNIPINLHAQWYYGYGESLLQYDKRFNSIRVGISI